MKQTKLFFAFAVFAVLAGLSLRAQTVLMSQNFNSLSAGSTLPAGWTNNMIQGNATYDFWRIGQTNGTYHAVGNPGQRSAASPFSGMCAIFDADNTSGGSTPENVALESPAFNTEGVTTVRLKFNHLYQNAYASGAHGNVEVFNGTTWVSVATFNSFNSTAQDIDISAHAANKTNARVRFRFVDNWGYWWMLDNIEVYTPMTFFIREPFTTVPVGSTPPVGWTNNIIQGSASVDFWRFGVNGQSHSVGNPSGRLASAPVNGMMAIFDADATSGGITPENVAFESPSVNTTGSNVVKLKWDQHYQNAYASGAGIFVEVFNGTTWVQVYTANAQAINSQDIDVSAHAANKSNTKVRFRFVDNWGYWWIVDNIHLYVPLVPIPNFTINNATQCMSGHSFTFTNTSTIASGTMTYLWQFGDNTTSTATSPTKTYATAGTYNVKLTVTGSNGTTAEITKQVVVNANTFPDVTVTNNFGSNTICTGSNVTFTATPSNAGASPTYKWTRNNATVSTASTYNAGTTLTNGEIIGLTVTSNGVCPAPSAAVNKIITMTVASSLTPSVAIAANTGASTCVGNSVTFTATPANGGTAPTYQWFKNNVSVGTGTTYAAGTGLVTGDQVRAQMTSNIGCPTSGISTVNSSTTTMTINPLTAASVSINVTPSSTGCQNQTFVFTATPTGGGSTPVYQWKRDGQALGINSPTLSIPSNSLNGHTFTAEMSSSLQCPATKPAVSNPIVMTVHPVVTPKVVIAASPAAAPYCFGAPINFTAAPTAGGTAPTYQWKLDGVNTVTTPTYSTPSTLAAGAHTVTCTMTSNYPCPSTATATATYNFTISPIVTPSVSIASTQIAANGDLCQGVNVTYTATPVNPGSAPTYQWTKNNVVVGTSSTSYNAGTTLQTGDVIVCRMTSNAACQSTNFSQSAPSTPTVWTNVTNSATIVSDAPNNSWCSGLPVTFTATSVNGGLNPVYQWRKGSTNVGSNSPVYVDAALNNNDQIRCLVTTSRACATPAQATSNIITMTMNPVIPTTIEITVNPDTVGCEGDPFLFAASFTNGGTTPVLQWYTNGIAVPGAKQLTFSSNTLQTGDQVTCELTSSMTCAFPEMSAAKTVTLTPSPVPTAVIGGYPSEQGVTFYSTVTNGGPGIKYQWLNNGIEIEGATSATYSAGDLQPTDKISLMIESSLECAKPKSLISNSMEVFRVTDVKRVEATFKELNLFPNPNDGRFTIQGELQQANAGDAHIEVLNALGQVVYKADAPVNGTELKLSVDLDSRASAGMYMVRITIGERTETMRFVLN
jgi:PKD repeat protein